MEERIVITCLVFFGLFLATRAWFWCVAFLMAALASLFSMLASIFHFQILWAIGFFFLAIISWIIFMTIFDRKYLQC